MARSTHVTVTDARFIPHQRTSADSTEGSLLSRGSEGRIGGELSPRAVVELPLPVAVRRHWQLSPSRSIALTI